VRIGLLVVDDEDILEKPVYSTLGHCTAARRDSIRLSVVDVDCT
jgi:hypothetical protein